MKIEEGTDEIKIVVRDGDEAAAAAAAAMDTTTAEYVIVESEEAGNGIGGVAKGERQYVAITADGQAAPATAQDLLNHQNVEFLHHTDDGQVIGIKSRFFFQHLPSNSRPIFV